MIVASPAEQLLYSTVRVETDYVKGHGAGTAFLYSHTVGANTYAFLVTNKHVVEDATRGRLFFTMADGEQPKVGESTTVGFDDFGSRWFGHPDPEVDVAIMPIAPVFNEFQTANRAVFVKTLPSTLIPNTAALEKLDAIEQVVFVGYPNGMYDTVNLTPIVRVGVTATPVVLDYSGQKTFLIDASVFPGSSGSPVLILNTGSYSPKEGGLVVGGRLLLLGVLSGVFTRREKGDVEIDEIPTAQGGVSFTDQMIDLGLVWKAEVIQKTVLAFMEARGEAL